MHGLEMIHVEMVIYQLRLVSHAPQYNHFRGVYAVVIVVPFPITITNLLDLTRDLHNNKLTGRIPPQIGRLNLQVHRLKGTHSRFTCTQCNGKFVVRYVFSFCSFYCYHGKLYCKNIFYYLLKKN